MQSKPDSWWTYLTSMFNIATQYMLYVRRERTGCIVPDVPIQAPIYLYTKTAIMRSYADLHHFSLCDENALLHCCTSTPKFILKATRLSQYLPVNSTRNIPSISYCKYWLTGLLSFCPPVDVGQSSPYCHKLIPTIIPNEGLEEEERRSDSDGMLVSRW